MDEANEKHQKTVDKREDWLAWPSDCKNDTKTQSYPFKWTKRSHCSQFEVSENAWPDALENPPHSPILEGLSSVTDTGREKNLPERGKPR